MTSIPHLEDLTPRQIISALDLDWTFTEKIDGTFLELGLDDQGFYSRRKGGQPIRLLEDWPGECWANSYRSGHQVGEILLDILVRQGLFKVGEKLITEVVHGNRPNSVVHDVGQTTGWLVINSHLGGDIDEFRSMIKIHTQRLVSADGSSITPEDHLESWWVCANRTQGGLLVKARLGQQARWTRDTLTHLLDQKSSIMDLTNQELLDTPLNRRHPNCPPGEWTEMRTRIRWNRDQIQQVVRNVVMMFKELAYRALAVDQTSPLKITGLKEGVVVRTPELTFKIVDREAFGALNLFTHRIKYMLVGGRRPARPSFLSRTRDWPADQRLARLEVLRQRFIRHRVKLAMWSPRLGRRDYNHHYSGDLLQRTLNMFADTKKRIEDGR